MDSASYSLPSTVNIISTSGNEQKRPVPGSTARKAGGGGPGPLNSDTPGPFLFEGPEGQAPTSVLATGLGDPTRLDPSIAAGLSMSSNFAGSSSVAKGATMQESFIQAVIAAGQLDLLLTRLSGLSRERSRFVDFEEVFSIAVPNSSVANPIAGAAGATGSSVSVRVRRSLLPAGDNPAAALPVLRYLGSVESEKTVLRRSCLEVPTSGPLVSFLCSLGFKKDFDFVAEGHIFIRGRAKVLVYSVNQVEQYSHESGVALPKSWRNLLPRSYMVEVSAVGSPADDSLPKEVSGLMELLCPLVVPGRVDHARLVCR
ncbi:hypothetical protein AAHC03_016596 [Spirometra sp. Aus1]